MNSEVKIIEEILKERDLQDHQWGGPPHDDRHDWFDWRTILYRQLSSLSMAHDDASRRRRMIKIAAVAMAAVESMDRKVLDASAPTA